MHISICHAEYLQNGYQYMRSKTCQSFAIVTVFLFADMHISMVPIHLFSFYMSTTFFSATFAVSSSNGTKKENTEAICHKMQAMDEKKKCG